MLSSGPTERLPPGPLLVYPIAPARMVTVPQVGKMSHRFYRQMTGHSWRGSQEPPYVHCQLRLGASWMIIVRTRLWSVSRKSDRNQYLETSSPCEKDPRVRARRSPCRSYGQHPRNRLSATPPEKPSIGLPHRPPVIA